MELTSNSGGSGFGMVSGSKSNYGSKFYIFDNSETLFENILELNWGTIDPGDEAMAVYGSIIPSLFQSNIST